MVEGDPGRPAHSGCLSGQNRPGDTGGGHGHHQGLMPSHSNRLADATRRAGEIDLVIDEVV